MNDAPNANHPTEPPVADPPPPTPAPPPAALLVADGQAGEEVLRLRREVEAANRRAEDEARARREAEIKAAEAERKAQDTAALLEKPKLKEQPRRRFPTLLNHSWS